tara:strand:+ start:545 stop:1057 length:513 start_codon:yes stop_codon:yes gene_type:complete
MWQPLKRSEIDWKGKSKNEIISEMQAQLKDVTSHNKVKLTGKQLRKLAQKSYISLKNEEIWVNDIYQVNINREDQEWIHLSIKRRDKQAINANKWQHFQWIKNQLVGENHEGLELYPSEKRLVNTANQYHLWVYKNPKNIIPCGWHGQRATYDKSHHGAVQTLQTKGEKK